MTAAGSAIKDTSKTVVITARSGWASIDLGLVWQFRDLMAALSGRDVMLRYRQTMLGIVWVVLQPLLGAAIFSFLFGIIAKMPSHGVPYFLVSFAGLLGWTLFSGALTRIANCLVSNRQLITKVFFPRLILPISTIPSVLLDFAIGFFLLCILMIVFGIVPGVGLLLLPLTVIIMLTMALGIGLAAASLAVSYRDVLFVLPTITQLWLYASPVGYSASAVPDYLRDYYFLNPLAAPIETFRWCILGQGEPHLGYLVYSAAVAIACLGIGLAVFKSLERKFADVI